MKRILHALITLIFVSASSGLLAQIPSHFFNGGTSSNSFPFNQTSAGSNKVQWVYPPSDITPASGQGFIDAVYFKSLSTPNTYSFQDLRISMGHASFATFPSATYVTGLAIVYGPLTTNVTLQSNNWIKVQLPAPFYYDGVSSLVVEATISNASATGVTMAQDGSAGNKRIWGNFSATTGATGPGLTGFGYDLFGGFPCTDTPKTGIRAPKKVCPNKPFKIAPDSFYSDADYSWQYSTNGIVWSNFTGVPSLFGDILDSITVPKWYRCTIKCKANTNLVWTTPAHKVEIAPFYYCYCSNATTTDGGGNIGNLTIINNKKDDTTYKKALLTTGTGAPVYSNTSANKRYTSYHDSLSWPCFYRDTTYRFVIGQIHGGSSFSPGVAQVYIDYNRDGLYNPNTERVFVKALDGSGTPPHIVDITAKVPSVAEVGPTGMRVIISADTVKVAPCDSINGTGEVEDYIVEICHRPCDSMVPGGIVASTDTSMCAGYEYKLTDTTFEKERSAFTRAWQVSGDDMNWFNIANSQGKDTLQRVFTGQPLFYRLRTVCLPTSDTNYSPSTRINVKPGYKCYCYSKAIGLLGDTSDIGGVTMSTFVHNSGGPHLLNSLADRPRTDFTDITPIEFYTDSVYKFSVYHTMPVVEHGDAKITVFMDFNNDNDYDIPEERVYTGYSAIGNHVVIDNILVPTKAITDVPTGMRIILNNDVGPNIPSDSACGPYTSGETEDYLVVFRKQWAEGVENSPKLTGFSVNPNPTSGKFHIQFSTNQNISEVKVKITSVTGQLIQEGVYEHKGGMFYHEVDMGQKAKGVYFVELQADGDKLIRKLVVQ